MHSHDYDKMRIILNNSRITKDSLQTAYFFLGMLNLFPDEVEEFKKKIEKKFANI